MDTGVRRLVWAGEGGREKGCGSRSERVNTGWFEWAGEGGREKGSGSRSQLVIPDELFIAISMSQFVSEIPFISYLMRPLLLKFFCLPGVE